MFNHLNYELKSLHMSNPFPLKKNVGLIRLEWITQPSFACCGAHLA